MQIDKKLCEHELGKVWVTAENGKQIWECVKCHEEFIEYEDSQP